MGSVTRRHHRFSRDQQGLGGSRVLAVPLQPAGSSPHSGNRPPPLAQRPRAVPNPPNMASAPRETDALAQGSSNLSGSLSCWRGLLCLFFVCVFAPFPPLQLTLARAWPPFQDSLCRRRLLQTIKYVMIVLMISFVDVSIVLDRPFVLECRTSAPEYLEVFHACTHPLAALEPGPACRIKAPNGRHGRRA